MRRLLIDAGGCSVALKGDPQTGTVVALPIVILGLVVLHILALHEVGSNNPDGIDIKKNKDEQGRPLDGVPFHPYYTVHDLVGIVVFLFVFCLIMFF